ncbi:MAG: cupin domain-containing protein [Pseudomonadota bacterium]
MPKIDIAKLPIETGSGYPGHRAALMDGRSQVRLGKAAGLTQFGANLVMLEPGALSSLRHWHMEQDEFLVVTQGVCTLIDDDGETQLTAGECAAFPAGDANGHHIKNTSNEPAAFVVVGTHTPTETGYYADEDMMVVAKDGAMTFSRKDGGALD